MSTLSDKILKGNTPLPEGYLDEFVIDGTTESVEARLKAVGWDGSQPLASVFV